VAGPDLTAAGVDARLYRKGEGKETKLCFIGHGLMENRHGLLVDACLTLADGHAERVAALHMIEPRADRPTAITFGVVATNVHWQWTPKETLVRDGGFNRPLEYPPLGVPRFARLD
jgi:hypothetical protein